MGIVLDTGNMLKVPGHSSLSFRPPILLKKIATLRVSVFPGP